MKRLTKILMVFLISFILIPCTKVYGADIDDITFMRAHINESGGTNTNLLKFEDIDNKTVQVTAPSATVKVVSSCSAVEPGAIDSNGEPSCSSFVERNASGHDLFKPAPKQVKLVKINANSQDGKKIKVRYNNIGTYNGKSVGCEITILDIPDVDQPTYFQFSSVFSYGIHYWHAHGHKQHYKFFYTNDEIDVDFEGQGAYISINSFNKWPDASGKGTFGYKSAGGDQPGVETDESIWFGGSGYKTTKINFTEIYLGENMEPVKDDFNRLIIRPKKDVQDDRHHNKPNETKYSEAFLKNSIMLHINGNLEFFVDNSNLRYGFSRQYVWMELSTDMVFEAKDYNYDVDVACRKFNQKQKKYRL